MERRRSNKILSLKGRNGIWYKKQEDITNEITQYYDTLFKTNSPRSQDIENILIENEMQLSETSIQYLNKPFTQEKIKRAIFDIGKLKASGLDGFQAGFYQKYWDIVGEDTTNAILEILNTNEPMTNINKTFITLIPKIKIKT